MIVGDLRPAAGQSLDRDAWRVCLTTSEYASELVGTYTDRAGGALELSVSDLLVLVDCAGCHDEVRVTARGQRARLTASMTAVGDANLNEALAQGREFIRRLAAGRLRLVVEVRPTSTPSVQRQSCRPWGAL